MREDEENNRRKLNWQMIKRLLWEQNLYWKFMCTDKNNGNNKTKFSPPPFTPVTVLLTAEKLVSLWR